MILLSSVNDGSTIEYTLGFKLLNSCNYGCIIKLSSLHLAREDDGLTLEVTSSIGRVV